MNDAIQIQKPNGAIAQRATVAPLEFTPEQRKMIRDSFLNGASEAEASVLMELARLRRLNPITRQIHFVKRWDGERQREVWSAQVGIDGFRSIAERTGLYDGQDEPEFEYDSKGAMRLCRVRVYRKDWSRPVVGVAHFSEYAQTKKDGGLTKMWATKPHVMAAKCAEALAFRKAFPEDTSGLYAPEEMPDEREVNPSPHPATQKRTDAVKAALQAKASTQTIEAATPTPPPPERKMPPIVDVQPGQTEAQAAAAAKPAPRMNGYRKAIADAMAAHDLRGKPAAEFALAATGKAEKYDANDLALIQSALAAEFSQPPAEPEPPPLTEADAPF